ncbi:hypothetical protein [Mesorhizobium sp. Pch-S]|uniref:hypothetical protein n=1 Tax=Mesorhizobium sp. Pch-S TaxID=2082387 RepID=UPI00101315FB|nr:hypothetical protein [Mesorhizobium sp. Pch-S]
MTQKDTNGDGSITAADGYVLNYNNAIEPGKDGFTTSVKANSAAWQTAVGGVPSGSSIFAAMNALTDSTTQNMVVSQNQSHVVMATDLGDHFGLLGVTLNSPDGYLQLHA